MHDTPLARILIVDDEEAQMKALCDTLREQGFEVLGFTTGQSALDALRERNFDLLLADLMMPDIDGIALLQAAQVMDANLVCIIMTGNGTVATAVEAMRMGALDYVLKPFKLSVMLPVLSRALTVRRLRMENTVLEERVRERTAELETANVELERARQAKDRFLATMSHELRTPLNAILGYTGLLLMKLPGPLNHEQEGQLGIVKTSGEHLLSLINDLLDVARIESGKTDLSPEPLVCQEVLHEVVTALRPMASGKGLTLDVVAPVADVCLRTDRRALFQIVMNLANNAIKYTHTGSVLIELSQRMDDGHMITHISVTDTGIGIKQDDQAKLFIAFAQVGDINRQTESTGLGLYLSAELAKLLGGRIALKSEYGSGSIFTLSFPNLQ